MSCSPSCDSSLLSKSNEAGPNPPPLPPDRAYTANWCEENIYLLVKQLLKDGSVRETWSVSAIFISNKTRTVALWSQKLHEDVVVWDYHVILALNLRPGATPCHNTGAQAGACWIYDLDSRLETPCRWEDYVAFTFPYATPEAEAAGWTIPEAYRSLFRIVPGQEFLEEFASDRSHMLVTEPGPPHYQSPEPAYPCIRGSKAIEKGVMNNLMSSLVCMDVENTDIGRVYILDDVKAGVQDI